MPIITPGKVNEAPGPSRLEAIDQAPPWRQFRRDGAARREVAARPMPVDQIRRARAHVVRDAEAQIIDAALALRRPVLVTGPAGVGKSSIAYAVAWQLGLGPVLRWGVTSRSTLADALYQYDVLARLNQLTMLERTHSAEVPSIGDYLRLGPLGTALLPTAARHYFPRVLLIDEIDKCDADLPSDLLHVLEEGQFEIPEIARLPEKEKPGGQITLRSADPVGMGLGMATVPGNGVVQCDDFPLIIMTSNGEREFSPAFLRRCLQLAIPHPDAAQLREIVDSHFPGAQQAEELIRQFVEKRSNRTLSTDQLLNAIFVARQSLLGDSDSADLLWRNLEEGGQTGE
jgi:MoxR-like ATPase